MENKAEMKIIRMYNEENKSTYEIAEALNTYPNKIRRTLKKHGVSLKTKSDAQKLALEKGSASHPTKGKKRTKKEKLKISGSMADYWESLSESEREERSEQAKERWNSMTVSQKEKMRVAASEAIRKAGKQGSKLERFIGKNLSDNGYGVVFHSTSLIPTEKLEIDLYIPDLRTIIEVDGPSHFLPIWGEDKLQKQIKADLHKSGIILSRGYAIVRIKAMEYPNLKKREDLVSRLLKILSNIKDKFPPKTERFIEVEL
jgi:very-short-patch-repair endonuclease